MEAWSGGRLGAARSRTLLPRLGLGNDILDLLAHQACDPLDPSGAVCDHSLDDLLGTPLGRLGARRGAVAAAHVDAEPLLPPLVRREEEREPLLLEELSPRLPELPLRLDELPLRLDELPLRLDELPLRLDEPLGLRDGEPALEEVPLRTPRTAPRATPPTTSPALSAPATPRTAPRRSVSRVRGENTAAVAAATNADSVLNTSSSAKGPAPYWGSVVRYPDGVRAQTA